jgi:uncharacterized phiE125 gp8 family phage protein
MYAPVLVTPPADLLDRAEVKMHLRVDGDDEDGLIDGLIGAATAYLDGYSGVLGRALLTQTWQVLADDFCRTMRLPMPASSIANIKSRNAAGQIATVASTSYDLRADTLGSYVRFKDGFSFPADLAETQAVTIDFVTGYGTVGQVPAAIRQAALLLVGHWYQNREAVNVGNITSALPFAVEALLAPFRRTA